MTDQPFTREQVVELVQFLGAVGDNNQAAEYDLLTHDAALRAEVERLTLKSEEVNLVKSALGIPEDGGLLNWVTDLRAQHARLIKEQHAMNDRLAALLAPYSQAGPLVERVQIVVQQLAKMTQERDRLAKTLNTPEVIDFTGAVIVEAAHQRERWGMAHDAEKTDADWFWLVGYLAGKALHLPEKRLHHCIAAAAALANWHLYACKGLMARLEEK